MTAHRRYRTGMRWALWRWTDVYSPLIGELYLRRLHLIHTPFGSIMLHWIYGPDPQPHLHDHPVTFLSILLRGRYYEERDDGTRGLTVLIYRQWFNFIRHNDAHRIAAITRPYVLTLCFAGPHKWPWGFYTPKGWIRWQDYK